MYLLVLVLDDISHLKDVLQGWQDAGVRGVTILESTGLNRMLTRHQPGAMYAGFSQLFGAGRTLHNTLFAVVPDAATAEAAVAATEAIVGELSGPDTGIAFTVPLAAAWGVPPSNDAVDGAA